MTNIAHVNSRYLPPAVVFIDGILRHPFRIYSDTEGKLCTVVCELPLRSDGSYPIAAALLDWIEEKGVKELVVLEGIPVLEMPRQRETFFAAEPDKIGDYESKGLKMVSSGLIQGLAGSILNECLNRKITGIVFLTPAIAFMPDADAAAELIRSLNRVYDLNITTQDLIDQADKIKMQLKEIAQHHQRLKQAEEKRGLPEALYA
jgi:uncharacterized protein